ncbi:YfiT family bacillithiol transferase [Maribacter sp. 2-571]|uniref:YfiT family bacillithiol transferase n=1 Tax=Maribacter sp. 2-571 TaxID=3417569 RepID=UPI003D34B07A
MDNISLEKLRYPIGKFNAPEQIDATMLAKWIEILETLPKRLEDMVTPLSEAQLDTPYRSDGWTVRQVVHHVSDSHHHSYIRFKWGMTENAPVIKPYLEKEWSNLFDAKTAPIALSLAHLTAVHAKLVYFLKGLSSAELERTFIHPEGNVETTLAVNIGRYAWHGSHHFAHIAELLKRRGW